MARLGAGLANQEPCLHARFYCSVKRVLTSIFLAFQNALRGRIFARCAGR